MGKIRLFLFVLVACFLHHSAETYQREINDSDNSDIGPVYKIERNPDQNILTKSTSLKGGNQTKSSGLINQNIINNDYSKSKKIKSGSVLEKTQRLWLDKMLSRFRTKPAVGVKLSESQTEKNKMKNTKKDKIIVPNQMGLQGSDTENESVGKDADANDRKKVYLRPKFGSWLQSTASRNDEGVIFETKLDINDIPSSQKTTIEPDAKAIEGPESSVGKYIDIFDENYNRNATIASINYMDNGLFNDVTQIIHKNGTSFIIKPRTIFVEVDLTGSVHRKNNSELRSSSESENYNQSDHRISKRKAPPKCMDGCDEEDDDHDDEDHSVESSECSCDSEEHHPSGSPKCDCTSKDEEDEESDEEEEDEKEEGEEDEDKEHEDHLTKSSKCECSSEEGHHSSESSGCECGSDSAGDPPSKPSLGKCKIPSFMKHSELRCKINGAKVICKQRCVYGHTLRNKKRERRQTCYKRRGEWTPSRRFSDCKPQANCDVKLRYGKMKCISNHMDKKPYCRISCDLEKKGRTHRCDKRGRWHPELPKCAKHGGHRKGGHRKGGHRGGGNRRGGNHGRGNRRGGNRKGGNRKGGYRKGGYHPKQSPPRREDETIQGKAFVMKEFRGPE